MRLCAEHGIPTSMDFNGCDPAHIVVSFNNGDIVVYDLETSQVVTVLKGQGDSCKNANTDIKTCDAVCCAALLHIRV